MRYRIYSELVIHSVIGSPSLHWRDCDSLENLPLQFVRSTVAALTSEYSHRGIDYSDIVIQHEVHDSEKAAGATLVAVYQTKLCTEELLGG